MGEERVTVWRVVWNEGRVEQERYFSEPAAAERHKKWIEAWHTGSKPLVYAMTVWPSEEKTA